MILRHNLRGRSALLLALLIVSSGNAVNQAETLTIPTLTISRHNHELVIRGAISSDANQEILLRTANKNFSEDHRTLDLKQGPLLPPGWALISEIALASMAPMNDFDLTLQPNELSVSGIADSEAQSALALGKIQRILPQDMNFRHNVQVIHKDHSFDKLCQQRFAATLKGRRIQFNNSERGLSTQSHALLDALVEISFDCPRAYFTAIGHSDDRGDEAYNVDLSLQRAKAAIEYMQKRGVAANRLAARGSGSANPVADNETSSGRRQNRRLEFTMEVRNPESNH